MTDNSINQAVATANGPGRLIRAARDSAKLSLEDLAAVIKLPRNTVDALERDDFATLKEPVYVRGYYRKLSKVLPVSEADLLAAYGSVAAPHASTAPSKFILSGNQELGGESTVNTALIGVGMVVTALVIALTAFWATRQGDVAETAPVAPQVQPLAAPVTAKEAPVVKSAATPAPAVVESGAALANAPALSAIAPAAAITPPPAEPAPVQAAAPTTATVAGEARLSIDAVKDCWVRIEDADGKKLVSSIVVAGEKLNISGKPPFAIAIGHVPGVQLRFNGTPVDMSSFVKSNGSARFSLP